MKHFLGSKEFKGEHWMTSNEAQEFFRVSRSTLYRWGKTKQLPFTKIGGVLYYPKAFIEALMGVKLQNNPFLKYNKSEARK
ncbi:helix-turn-helix domain-containing protein [Mariniflexile sp. HNIBRBA6329]|uniref:helix-turn-helix domain-containing protein n=1 Tax=Mariniflexile sp. HNIBRBA6329 TaxID=3373088 RepID=UPI00374512DF